MSSELLDFTSRENFDFFKFSVRTEEEKKVDLKRECEHVLEYAHATVQDMCVLGFHLKELKESKAWGDVFNPESGYCFYNHSFQAFCEYAFGFSNTRTSNLLRIAEFVKISGTKTGFIDEKYAEYNTSQLVELAPVRSEDRGFFSPSMSVADMRLAKDYMKMGTFFKDRDEADFEVLKYARAWKEGEKKPQGIGALPGQLEIEDVVTEEAPYEPPEGGYYQDGDLDNDEPSAEEENFEVESLQDDDSYEENLEEMRPSAKSDVGSIIEEPKEELIEDGSEIGEDRLPSDESEEIEANAEPQASAKSDVGSLSATSRYNFSIRAEIRAFMNDYTHWTPIYGAEEPFFSKYFYRFKNNMRLYAFLERVSTTHELDKVLSNFETNVRYFVQLYGWSSWVEVTKDQIEQYLMEHKYEVI